MSDFVEVLDKHGRTYHINRNQVVAIVTKESSGFLWVYFVAGNSVEIETYSNDSAVKAAARIRGEIRERAGRGSF